MNPRTSLRQISAISEISLGVTKLNKNNNNKFHPLK